MDVPGSAAGRGAAAGIAAGCGTGAAAGAATALAAAVAGAPTAASAPPPAPPAPSTASTASARGVPRWRRRPRARWRRRPAGTSSSSSSGGGWGRRSPADARMAMRGSSCGITGRTLVSGAGSALTPFAETARTTVPGECSSGSARSTTSATCGDVSRVCGARVMTRVTVAPLQTSTPSIACGAAAGSTASRKASTGTTGDPRSWVIRVASTLAVSRSPCSWCCPAHRWPSRKEMASA